MAEVAKARAAQASRPTPAPNASGPKSTGEPQRRLPYIPPHTFRDELEEVQSMPEVASMALLLSATAKHMHMREFSVADLEAGLLRPRGSDVLAVVLSRWLVRDPELREAVGGKDDALEWDWIEAHLRATVRAWYARRARLHAMCETLEARCIEDAVQLRAASRHQHALLALEPGAALLHTDDGGGGDDSSDVEGAGAAGGGAGRTGAAVEVGAGARLLRRGDAAAASAAAAARTYVDDDTLLRARRQREAAELEVKLAALAAERDIAMREAPAAAGGVSSSLAAAAAAADDATGVDEPEGDGDGPSALPDGAAPRSKAPRKPRRNEVAELQKGMLAELARANVGGLGGVAAASGDAAAAVALARGAFAFAEGHATRRRGSAGVPVAITSASAAGAKGDDDEAELAEDPGVPSKADIVGWMAEGLGQAGAAAALIDSWEEPDEAEVGELSHWDGVLGPLGPADPLAATLWSDAPLRTRVAVLYALLTARASGDCADGDDVAAAVRAAAEEAPDRLRLTQLGGARSGGAAAVGAAPTTAYFTFPAGAFPTDIRVFAETRQRLASGRASCRWRVVAFDSDSLAALTKSVGGGDARPGSYDRRLADALAGIAAGAGARADAARARADKARERAEKRELLALLPRRTSNRLHTDGGPEGGAAAGGDGGGGGAAVAVTTGGAGGGGRRAAAAVAEAAAEADAADVAAFFASGGSDADLRDAVVANSGGIDEDAGEADWLDEPEAAAAAPASPAAAASGAATDDSGGAVDVTYGVAVASSASGGGAPAPPSPPAAAALDAVSAAPPDAAAPTARPPRPRGRPTNAALTARLAAALLARITRLRLVAALEHLGRADRCRAVGVLVSAAAPRIDRFAGFPLSARRRARPTAERHAVALEAAYHTQMLRERDRARRRGKERNRAAREAAAGAERAEAARAAEEARRAEAEGRSQQRAIRKERRDVGIPAHVAPEAWAANAETQWRPSGIVLRVRRVLGWHERSRAGAPPSELYYLEGMRGYDERGVTLDAAAGSVDGGSAEAAAAAADAPPPRAGGRPRVAAHAAHAAGDDDDDDIDDYEDDGDDDDGGGRRKRRRAPASLRVVSSSRGGGGGGAPHGRRGAGQAAPHGSGGGGGLQRDDYDGAADDGGGSGGGVHPPRGRGPPARPPPPARVGGGGGSAGDSVWSSAAAAPHNHSQYPQQQHQRQQQQRTDAAPPLYGGVGHGGGGGADTAGGIWGGAGASGSFRPQHAPGGGSDANPAAKRPRGADLPQPARMNAPPTELLAFNHGLNHGHHGSAQQQTAAHLAQQRSTWPLGQPAAWQQQAQAQAQQQQAFMALQLQAQQRQFAQLHQHVQMQQQPSRQASWASVPSGGSGAGGGGAPAGQPLGGFAALGGAFGGRAASAPDFRATPAFYGQPGAPAPVTAPPAALGGGGGTGGPWAPPALVPVAPAGPPVVGTAAAAVPVGPPSGSYGEEEV